MRRLVLLALAALAAVSLSAHDGWRGPRRMVVEDSCRPYHRGEERRWEHRGYDRHVDRRYGCDDDRVFLRPRRRSLASPFQGRVELWVR